MLSNLDYIEFSNNKGYKTLPNKSTSSSSSSAAGLAAGGGAALAAAGGADLDPSMAFTRESRLRTKARNSSVTFLRFAFSFSKSWMRLFNSGLLEAPDEGAWPT